MVELAQACILTPTGDQIPLLLLNLHTLTRLQQNIYQKASQKEPLGFGSKAPQRIDTLLSRVLSHPYLISGVELSVNLGYCGAEPRSKYSTATAVELSPKRQKHTRNVRPKQKEVRPETEVRHNLLAPLKRISLELWTYLLGYLPTLDVVAAGQVCKAWYYASIQDPIWTAICRQSRITCEAALLARLVFQRALFENYILKSGKFLALDIILHTVLEEAADAGGKVVVSVMAETRATLDLLEDVLCGRHLTCYRLDHRGLPEVKKDVGRAVETTDSPLIVFLLNSAGFRHAPTQLDQLVQALRRSSWILSLEVPRGNAQQLLGDIAQWAAPSQAQPKLIQLLFPDTVVPGLTDLGRSSCPRSTQLISHGPCCPAVVVSDSTDPGLLQSG
jgi:hypothetical protein